MHGHESNVLNELERVNGLLAWWGHPDTGDTTDIRVRARRLQLLMMNQSKGPGDTSFNQTRAMFEANDRFHNALHGFLSAREAPEILATRSDLVRDVLESLATQVQACTELTQKLRTYCLSIASSADGNDGEEEAGSGQEAALEAVCHRHLI